MSGFYDPCIGEEKSLKLVYEFRELLHEVVVKDDETLRIPLQCKFKSKILCLNLINILLAKISLGCGNFLAITPEKTRLRKDPINLPYIIISPEWKFNADILSFG